MDTKPWWQSKTIWGGIIGFAVTALSLFHVNISDQVPELTTGILGTVGLIGTIMVIVGRVKGAGTMITATKDDSPPSVPGARLFLVPLLAAAVLSSSCAQGPVYTSSPIAAVGGDFQVAATQALEAYAEYKAGNANLTWALQEMFNAYSLYATDSNDVKTLIKAWTGNTGDSQKLADRLARIFGASTKPPDVKMAALAQVAQNVAAAKTSP